MTPLLYAIIAGTCISFSSLLGVVALSLREKLLSKIIIFLVSISSGVLMGNAFLHLLPEASETLPPETIYTVILISFIFFFLVEKIFHWRHCHDVDCHEHSFGYVNLVGDAIHNCIDGIIIGGTFATNIGLGIVTAITIATHEIPKEIGDFGVLLHAGFSKKKAMVLNFSVALMIVVGGMIGVLAAEAIGGFVSYLLPFAAGGFLYISASDLIPELRKEDKLHTSILSFVFFLLGIGFSYLTKFIGTE